MEQMEVARTREDILAAMEHQNGWDTLWSHDPRSVSPDELPVPHWQLPCPPTGSVPDPPGLGKENTPWTRPITISTGSNPRAMRC